MPFAFKKKIIMILTKKTGATNSITGGKPNMNILLVIAASLAVTIIIVAVNERINTSPTQDDNCRGGHDF